MYLKSDINVYTESGQKYSHNLNFPDIFTFHLKLVIPVLRGHLWDKEKVSL
jgi:hypothetical protein